MLSAFARYKFTVITTILIILVSLLPGNSLPEPSLFHFRHMDKLVHTGMYGCLALASLSEMRCRAGCLARHILVLLLILIMSLFLEFIQDTAINGRTAEWADFLANLSGVLSGYGVYHIIRRIRS